MTGMNGADFQGKMKESETLRQEHEKRAGTKRTMKDRVLSGCSYIVVLAALGMIVYLVNKKI